MYFDRLVLGMGYDWKHQYEFIILFLSLVTCAAETGKCQGYFLHPQVAVMLEFFGLGPT